MKKLSRDEMKKVMGGSNAPAGDTVCAGEAACGTGRCCWVQGSNWGYGKCNGALNCCVMAC
ncbi:MAG TPA: hypothetical protein VLR49_12835 [Ferruginibacter sp.]|nr:hypothetical protein [Ferruginibacter sp.]